VMPAVLAQAIELLCIVIHNVTSLPEGHKTFRNVVDLEGLLEFISSDCMPLLHSLEMIPPH
jgi:hypothetical protein